MTTYKYGRTYRLEIYLVTGEKIVIEPPFTLNFNITRNAMASANTGTFSIYNLKPDTRSKLFHDRFDTTTYQTAILYAGYKGNVPMIFNGNIRMAYSTRQGTEWITRFDCFDAGYAMINGDLNDGKGLTVPKNYGRRDAINTVIAGMPNVTRGVVSQFQGQKISGQDRGMVLTGNAWDTLKCLNPGGLTFIDNNKVNVLDINEYISAGQVLLINSKTGLIDTPRRQDASLRLKTLLEPNIAIGEIVQVESLEKENNNQYQVIGLTHSGTISEAVCADATTQMDLWIGSAELKAAA